ncbi:TAP-like protein-domain-containing protein [Podospora didyma]|uniref:TAP-like protein-domain-containing protein n=1 Tax=Podospora didyma TaxID=330526 RepID=A0AAE0NTX6_9PEZI|nr:TAP-like protein-domain-containing protein [Podospora didyma]
MSLLSLFTTLALASIALTKPVSYPRVPCTPRSQTISWGPCSFPNLGSSPIECGILFVPVDYTSPALNETFGLPLFRSRATKPVTPSKGSILFNFGGPGYEAVQSLNSLADFLHLGVVNTLRFSCFDTPADRLIAAYKFPILAIGATDVALVDTWASTQVYSNICQTKNNNTNRGGVIGTAYVARDMMRIVDALNEDGLLRFWGFSYGSLLGETVAAMFPDRIDRLVLDGVVNGHNYYHRQGVDVDQLLSADDAFLGVLDQCITAGPAKCALATVNSTAADLAKALNRLAEEIRTAPIAVGDTVINFTFVKELLFIVIKYPSDVANAALHINNLLHRQNLTGVVDYYKSLQASIAMGDDDAIWGIKCSDTFPRSKELSEVMPDIEHMSNTSSTFGPYVASVTTICANWPFEAKERYAGDFKVKTRFPILFVGNTYDPATPVASARNMSASFEGSVVLEQHGFGHASLSQLSACTTTNLQAYFVNGTLPASGTVCEVDASLFK